MLCYRRISCSDDQRGARSMSYQNTDSHRTCTVTISRILLNEHKYSAQASRHDNHYLADTTSERAHCDHQPRMNMALCCICGWSWGACCGVVVLAKPDGISERAAWLCLLLRQDLLPSRRVLRTSQLSVSGCTIEHIRTGKDVGLEAPVVLLSVQGTCHPSGSFRALSTRTSWQPGHGLKCQKNTAACSFLSKVAVFHKHCYPSRTLPLLVVPLTS